MSTPDNARLIEDAKKAWASAVDEERGRRLANALEASEAEIERWKDLALRAGDKIATAIEFAEGQRNRADVLQGLTLTNPEEQRAEKAEKENQQLKVHYQQAIKDLKEVEAENQQLRQIPKRLRQG